MSQKPRGGDDRSADADRLAALERRIAELTPKPSGPGPMGKYEQANLAWRMVVELVAGLGLGFAVGFGLDYLLGTGPWLMVVFIFLGLAAGIKTMMRTAGELDRTSGRDGSTGLSAAPDDPTAGTAPAQTTPGPAPDRDERD